MTSRYICPFCGDAITEAQHPVEHALVEAKLRDHLAARHPIRWRLSRRFRRAMKGSAAGD